MNALELLKSDHQRVRDLFIALREASTVGEKREIYETIREELETHSEIEEQIFYPAFQQNHGEEIADLVTDAIEDHQEMRDILNDIEDSAGDDEDLVDLMDELVDLVESHIQDEEGVLFEEIRDQVAESDLESLGERMSAAKRSGPRAA